MKSFLVVACLCLVVAIAHADLIDTYLENSKDAFTKCAKENGYNEGSLREIFDKDSKLGLEGATCLRACTLKDMGLLKDSKMNIDGVNTFVEKALSANPDKVQDAQKAAADCVASEKSQEECKLGFAYVECFLKNHS